MRTLLALGTAITLALAGCGGDEPTKTPGTSTGNAPVQVGILCAGSTTDGGWNAQGADAATAAAKATGGTVTVTQQVTVERVPDVLRDLAKRGATVAICHGFEFLAKAEEVAAAQDKMKIAVTGADPGKKVDGSPKYEHIYMLDIDINGPSYQLGVLAGKLTKSGKLGFIGGSQIPPVESALKAFDAGAKSVRPDATVAIAWTSWDEPLKSKTQAEAFLQKGVDVIYHDLDTASKGVFEAVKANNAQPPERPKFNVWVIGCNSDQNANLICPESTIASCVIRLDQAFAGIVKAAQAGTFKPGIHTLNLANGETACVLNPKLTAEGGPITKEIQQAVEDAGKKVLSGEAKW